MVLTELQRRICRLLARTRVESGESYVAGAVALNEAIGAMRISRDIDLFHDTDEALMVSWQADRRLLEASGFDVEIVRERPTFIEAHVASTEGGVRVEWARDSAFRFFPLVAHPDFGLVLHPFDLATNKVLALVGRLEVRDWVDVIESDAHIQPLGYLAWAACAKDPGFAPGAILDAAARSARYAADEVAELAYEGDPPDAATLGRRWHGMLADARRVVGLLPPGEMGSCVLGATGDLERADPDELARLVQEGLLTYHHGRIGGVLPMVGGLPHPPRPT
ncbi:MAG: hypothetical protein KF809_03390 [Chloroflexi bacterium]|nr:hypothetical protein [Chloroflexota bacterium]